FLQGMLSTEVSTGEAVTSGADNPQTEGSGATESTSVVGQEKKKMTKAEKKAHFGISVKDEPLKTWRDVVKELLAPGDKSVRTSEEEVTANELAENVLTEVFGGVENPYQATYDIYDVFSDKIKYKRVHRCLFKTFEAWIEKCGTPEKIEGWLTSEFKVETMKRIVNKGTGQLENLLRIFQLKEIEVTEIVEQKITDMCTSASKHQFPEAMKLAKHFELHERFDVDLFLIPCLLKNKQDDVEQFVKGHHTITRKLVRFLDDLIDESDSYKIARLQAYIDRKVVTKQVVEDFINGKKVQNILKKLVSPDFEMEDSDAPKYEIKKTKDKLRYLLFDSKKVICTRNADYGDEGSRVFTATIFDHVKDHVKKGSKLAKDVIIALFDRVDREKSAGMSLDTVQHYYYEAEMWMMYYELSPSDFRGGAKNYFERTNGWEERARRMLSKFNTVDARSECQLEDGTPIKWIDTWFLCDKTLDEIELLEEVEAIIGIDSEFRSTNSPIQQVALLQVSTIHRVYLFDFVKLENCLTELQWKEFTSRLFGGEHIKIGFDMLSDLNAYSATLPFVKDELQRMTRVICLKRLANDLLDLEPTLFDLSKSTSWIDRAARGAIVEGQTTRTFKLSDLVEVILHITLNKKLQTSNWSIRPLRPEQLIYAATDAYILIKLHLGMKRLTNEKNRDFDEIVKSIWNDLAEKKKDQTVKKKKAKMTDEEYAELVESVNAAVLSSNGHIDQHKSFITDAMFSGLGKHLRRLGVDVEFADSKESLVRMAKYSQNQHRIILSFGKNLAEYQKMFEGRVFGIDSSLPAAELIRAVLTNFNMKMDPANVFTRCMLCNGDQFVMTPSIVLQTLHDCVKRIGDTEDDDEMFDPQPWMQKIKNADASDYGGFDCSLVEFSPQDNIFIVKCTNGVIDVYNNLVMGDSMGTPIDVKTINVQPEVIESERPFYYICAKCGKVYWDGTHFKRYKGFVDDLANTENSLSDISVVD
ncbi:hypothetical protein PFISCL1PPCAC_5793, partial [Pristionchus fissidentatus]